ncbi:MAG: hypothetical protein ABL977_00740 [Candidatus Eisenbacteria bacterium]
MRAGECIDGDEDYLRILEQGPAAIEQGNELFCLDLPDLGWGRAWDGPVGQEAIASFRAAPLRERFTKALTALWESPWADSSQRRPWLVRLAATRGIARLGSTDVYSELVGAGRKDAYKVFVGSRFYQLLAILDDCRAAGLLRKRYHELAKRPRRGYVGERLDIVCSLHYLECPEASVVARELEASESDSTLCWHLARVGKR